MSKTPMYHVVKIAKVSMLSGHRYLGLDPDTTVLQEAIVNHCSENRK